jgi:hypothetical protein
MTIPSQTTSAVTRHSRSVFLLIAIALTILFWGPLWVGYGFVGGDLYPYFFPQKAYFADRLHAGEFPLWNNLTGFGYPVLGESQTGAAYPPYLLAYYFLDVNTAYNLEHLLHYVLCFTGVCLYGRRIGLSVSGAVLAAIVFTYGWFPPRACLEWAIVTGAWLPVALWCVESFVQTRYWRYSIGLSLVLGLQLLAGHFHLAFMTQLVVLAYGLWRIRPLGRPPLVGKIDGTVARHKSRMVIALLMSVTAGFLLAAIQLIPAWELKTRSSRATVGAEHEPSYGHLPPLYVSQMVAPWLWYSPLMIDGSEAIRTIAELGAPWHWFGPHRDQDELLMASRAGGLTSIATNKVEAHLYCGLIPLGLAVWWAAVGHRRRTPAKASTRRQPIPSSGSAVARGRGTTDVNDLDDPVANSLPPLREETWFWVIVGGLALIFATGLLLPIARHVPGFNFFRGPGRYGIVTTLAVAILAGRGLGAILERRSGFGRIAIVGCILWSTVGDLWLVSRMVNYAVMVSHPPITFRDRSPVRKLLLEEPLAPRLYAPGQNLGNLLGVSCLPVYLGIAPSAYSDPKFAGEGMPLSDGSGRAIVANDDFSKWLRDSGVTHLLAFDRLDESTWRAELIWQGVDPLLNSAWGRSEPLFLYKLKDSSGRASIASRDRSASAIVPRQNSANRFVVDVVNTDVSNQAAVIVRELRYPGWVVLIDGHAATETSLGTFREAKVPEGTHQLIWTYRPLSVILGAILSGVTLLILAVIGHLRYWYPKN